MIRLPLRWALIVPMVALLALGSAMLVWYADRSVGAELLASTDKEVTRAVEGARGQPPLISLNDDMPVQLDVSADGTLIPDGRSGIVSAAEVASLLSHPGMVMTVGESPGYRALAVSGEAGGSRIFALSLRSMEATMTHLRATLAISGLAIFLGTVIVLWAASRQVTRGVHALASAATQIAEGDLSVAIPASDQVQETATLSAALRTMVTRLATQIDERDDALARATQATAEQQRVMADMAHELLTPLTALAGYSQLHERGMLKESDSLDRAMNRIGAESNRLTSLVQDVLNLEHYGSARSLSWGEVDVREVITGVCSDLRAAFPDQGIEVADAGGSCLLVGDRDALQQVFVNVGANACRYAPSGSPVILAVGSDDHTVTVSVIDHGSGIPPEARQQVFEAFHRIDRARSRDLQQAPQLGAGLGLTISRAVVDAHHGTIEISDTAGGGATVVIHLPREASTGR